MFQAQVEQWVRDSEELTLVVMQTAAQEMAISANTPTAQGGRLRVDTGFLRNSINARVGSLPTGPNIAPEGFNDRDWNPSSLATVINSWRLGQTLYIGWTANYAGYRENNDFFARTAAQSWPEFVNDAANRLRGSI